MPPFDILAALVAEAKGHPMTSSAVILLSFAVGYGYLGVLPQVEQNSRDVAAITQTVSELRPALHSIQLSSLRADINRARQQQCLAASPEGRQYFQSQIETLQQQFLDLTRSSFTLPDCSIYK